MRWKMHASQCAAIAKSNMRKKRTADRYSVFWKFCTKAIKRKSRASLKQLAKRMLYADEETIESDPWLNSYWMTAVAKEKNVPWKSTENIGTKTSPRIDDEMFSNQDRIGDHFIRFFQYEGGPEKKKNSSILLRELKLPFSYRKLISKSKMNITSTSTSMVTKTWILVRSRLNCRVAAWALRFVRFWSSSDRKEIVYGVMIPVYKTSKITTQSHLDDA